YSGKFGEALEAMKAKAQELLDKIARGEKPNKEDYQEYNNICKAIKSGIESIKNTTQTQNPNPKFLAKIAPILNDLDSYKDKLLAEADCDGIGYHSELREEVFYASTKSQLYPEALVSICKLGESSSLAGNILNRTEDLAVETAAAKSSIKCGCDGLMDYLTGDGNCQSVIYNLELLKRDISKNKVSHKLNNPAGATGQVKVGEVCIDNLQIRFYGDNPEINALSKEKTQEGIDFSATNSSNIVLNVNVLDKAEKDKKIEAVWRYLGDKTQEDHQASFPVTGTQLHEIFPDTPQDRCDEVASIINKYSDDYGLTTPERMAHFIGQIGAETMLKNLDEKSYSASRILTADKTRTIRTHNGKKVLKYCSIFEGYSADGASCPYPYCDEDIVVPEGSYSGSYASTTFMQGMNKIVRANMVDELPRDPDFFNVVYACNDIGNGNINSGDGYRFRGRGFMQITGYSNYRKMVQAKWDAVHGTGTKDFMCRSSACDKNLDNIANDLDFSMLISLTFWKAGNTNEKANEVNKDSIKAVTRAVNGKEIGIDNRTLYTNKAYETLKK
ncbi:Predicted chitinase, partial [Pseudarcicella hirudinis]